MCCVWIHTNRPRPLPLARAVLPVNPDPIRWVDGDDPGQLKDADEEKRLRAPVESVYPVEVGL